MLILIAGRMSPAFVSEITERKFERLLNGINNTINKTITPHSQDLRNERAQLESSRPFTIEKIPLRCLSRWDFFLRCTKNKLIGSALQLHHDLINNIKIAHEVKTCVLVMQTLVGMRGVEDVQRTLATNVKALSKKRHYAPYLVPH